MAYPAGSLNKRQSLNQALVQCLSDYGTHAKRIDSKTGVGCANRLYRERYRVVSVGVHRTQDLIKLMEVDSLPVVC